MELSSLDPPHLSQVRETARPPPAFRSSRATYSPSAARLRGTRRGRQKLRIREFTCGQVVMSSAGGRLEFGRGQYRRQRAGIEAVGEIITITVGGHSALFDGSIGAMGMREAMHKQQPTDQLRFPSLGTRRPP